MKRRKRSSHPFSLWSNLALQTADMMLGSMQVIGHRTRRMAAAGSTPNARDRKEFAVMGQEKLVAAAKSFNAMAACVATMHQQAGVRMMRASLESAKTMMSLATSPSVARSMQKQARLARTLTGEIVEASNRAARLSADGLRPVHARVKANVKRLGKRKKG